MLRLATRGSALALWQAEEVARLLRAAHPGLEVELVRIETSGDRRQDREVWEIGGQGVFVKEVQAAVLAGDADVAVHSAKDLPSTEAPWLTLAAFPKRGDPRDALVGATLDDLGPGATVATGSVRRRAQLAHLRPDLSFVGLRGNIATRLAKMPQGGAVLVARAALDRLELGDRVAQTLDPAVMMPQVAQGALAVECRTDDQASIDLVSALDDLPTATAVRAERAFLARLGSGCDLPVGAYATLQGDGMLQIDGVVASIDGLVVLRDGRRGRPEAAVDLGSDLAVALLDEAGARALLTGGAGDPARGGPGRSAPSGGR